MQLKEKDKELILKLWKNHTVADLQRLVPYANHHSISKFLLSNGIEPITKRDLITKKVLELHEDTSITDMVTIIGCSLVIIKEIMEEYQLTPKSKKEKDKEDAQIRATGSKRITAYELKKLAFKDYIANINENRPKAVYNQSGSDLTDSLRGIQTTVRVHA